jgi:hypothetical protein
MKTETKFTKGEWKILWGNYTHFATINTDSMHRICALEVDQSKGHMIGAEEQEANAKLIAAAPELYDVCVNVLTKWHSKSSNFNKKEPEYLQPIRDALQKAGYWDE